MEDSLMRILELTTTRIESLIEKAKGFNERIGTCIPEKVILEAEVNASKLKNGLTKLGNDLNTYFRYVNVPAVDEVSRITTVQLEAEEILCELQINLERSKPSTSAAPTPRASTPIATSKLPKLSLPEFHGDILQWHQFWDQFSSLVDSRNLNDVDKFLYLTSILRSEAKKLVEGLVATNENYTIAVTTLKARYGRIELVKDAHYSALNKITPATTSVADCRKVFNEVERHLRVLQSLGEDMTHSYFRFMILEKFPEDLVYELKKRTQDDSVIEIRKELENLISAREDAYRISKGKEADTGYTTEVLHVAERSKLSGFKKMNSNSHLLKRNKGYQHKGATSQHLPNNSSLKRRVNTVCGATGEASTSSPRPEKRIRKECIFCRENHDSVNCLKYKTNKQRRSRLLDRCFRCLRKGHRIAQCHFKGPCYTCNQTSHPEVLCPSRINAEGQAKTNNTPTSSNYRRNNSARRNTTRQFHVKTNGQTILQTAVINVIKEDNRDSVKCRCLLDSGSQRSYITKDLAKKLNLGTLEESRLTVYTFGADVPREIDSPLVQFQMSTRSGEISMTTNVVPMITHSVPHLPVEHKNWPTKFNLADDGSLADRVDILIGNDYYFSLISTEKIKIDDNLYLVNSELGWIMSGKTDITPANELSVVTYFQTNLEVKLNQPDLPLTDMSVKGLWELEAIGITDSPKDSREEEALRNFNETTLFQDNRYHVSWPWVDYPPHLRPNYGLALGRLTNLIRRSNQDTLASYDQLLMEQERLGIVERVPEGDIKGSDYPVHYLPFHGIKQPNKPIRLVYDASSKLKDSKSLNQCLYCGPIMLEDLTGLLLKFRTHNIGICADVEKAFLQIGLQTKDRDVTRFLWVKDTGLPVDDDNMLHMRFCRVPFGIISSPFLLNATIKYHLSRSSSDNIKNLAQEIYVDNVVTGTESTKEAVDLYKGAKEAFQEMSMNLRDWSSNSRNFIRQVPDACRDKVVKVLGLDWDLETDTLRLRFKEREFANTKRGVLKCIASVYDPSGYAAPAMLPAKLFLQDLWKMKLKWDTPLSKDMTDKWNDIKLELRNLMEVCVPRCYVKDLHRRGYQIHCFVDSSIKAYAAVVYIVQGEKRSFVIGKSRLVPVKDNDDLKIPRLELLAFLIGHRLIQYVKKFLPSNFTQQVLWTDSQIVISWYKSDKLLTPFVAKRIQEVKGNKELSVRHIPTHLNPADVATRPSQPKEELKKWLVGPDFLSMKNTEWPINPSEHYSLLVREDPPKTSTVEDTDMRITSEVIDNPKKVMDCDRGIIYTTVDEIKDIQSKHFLDELAGKETSMKRNLDLFKDEDGILRCRGRFKNANWTYDKRYPILLPRDSDYTDNIIKKTHEDNYHVGASHTLSIIRQSFWIPQGRSRVLRIIKKCPQCVKHGGGPFKLPPTPALPTERVNYTEPYTFTGIDYLGPILIKTKTGTEKRWICLFTCLSVRAVHLEVVRDLTAEEGLLALRRFVSTRNVPMLITSDNATNFKLMSEVLSQPYCVEKKIKWRFIPQLAPWFGGFYERLVGIVKNCLKRTLQKHMLTDNQMNTIIKEIEAVINSRPLTYVDEELTHILKPSDFIAMGRNIVMETRVEGPLPQGTQTKVDLINSWRKGIIVLDEFKEMFINRYLMSLRERYSHSYKQPRSTSTLEPTEGQIVQIKGDSKNRENWQVGKIVSLSKGADNMCRVAQVKVGDREFTRSIGHLYPLEIEEDTSGDIASPRLIEEHETNVTEESPNVEIDIQDVEIIDNSRIHNEREQVIPTDTESIGAETAPTKSNSPINNDMSCVNADDSTGASPRSRPQRNAAIEARKKIQQWTSSLTTLLLAVGSVVNRH